MLQPSTPLGFERAVAIDGETMVIGSKGANVGANESQGAAYIFTRSGSTWTQQQKLTAPDGVANAEFGFSVAINGETAVVGAWQDSSSGGTKGAAYVFVRSGIFWLFQQKLTPSDGQHGDRFGRSVGIDGETVIVGLEPSVFLLSRPGSAYIFVRSGNNWTEQQKLSAPNVTFSNRMGSSVAIDRETVIVGAVWDRETIREQGSAYIFGTPGSSAPPPEKIAFSSNRDGNDEIYAMNPDGSGQARLTNDVGSDLHPSFSGDETRITFSSTRNGNSEIYVMNADGSEPLRLTNNAANDSQPSFSRDGLKIVFRSNRDGNDEIYSMTATGGNVTRLTNNSVADSEPSFSPAGNRVLYESLDGTGNRDLYLMNAVDGGSVTRLTTFAAADLGGNFSRNGTRIVFTSARNGNNEIYVMNADGTGQTRLTNNAFSDTEPFFSPDGTKIAFETDRDGNAEIYSMTADGTNQSRLTTNSTGDNAPDWGGIPSPSSAGRVSASDGLQGDAFGSSVAISGNTAIIGAVWDDFEPNFVQGSAYIFVRVGGTWVQQQKLFASDGGDGDEFGYRVAISGETAIVGAWKSDLADGFAQGAAYIFVRNGTVWTQQQKITASDGANNDMFGSSVAISGEAAIVGAITDDIGTNSNQGSAYVFVRSGTTWTQQQKLTVADGAAQDNFGSSTAISGGTAVIGAYNDDVTFSNQGSVYVFVRNGTTWSQQQQLNAADGAAQDNFGYSVGISGETVIVGAPFDDVGATVDRGSAYIFVRNGGVWTEQQRLTASDGAANDWLGWSSAISGETVIVGAQNADVSALNQGAAYTFVRSGSTWAQLQKMIAPDAAANDEFGYAVGMSGETAVVGARLKAIGATTQQGAGYFIATIIPPSPTPTPSPTPVPTVEPNTPVGVAVTVRIFDASVTFPAVTQAGDTIFVPIIPPASAGTPPAGYVICPTCAAYDITTTAVYTAPVNVCLGVPSGIGATAFSTMILLHGEGGILVDRTTGRFTNMDGDRTVCGSVSSLSPFVLAQTSGTPSPTPTPAGFESDVAPRANPDGAILSTDVTQIRRFVAGLDTINPAVNELQRTDSAPRATFGDGMLNSADVVQGRRYAAGLDPLTPAGGPTVPPAIPSLIDDPLRDTLGREIRVGKSVFRGADTISFPIEVTAQGNEAAISFTIEYDPGVLYQPSVNLGDAFATGAVLTVNDIQKGKLGILIDSDLAMIVGEDGRRVVMVTFKTSAEFVASKILLTSSLVPMSVSGVFGDPLGARWNCETDN